MDNDDVTLQELQGCPPRLNPFPPGERKLCIKTQLTRPLQEILDDDGLIRMCRRRDCLSTLDNPYLQC